jgi:hypothetical protein
MRTIIDVNWIVLHYGAQTQKRGFFKIEDEFICKNPLELDLNCAKAAHEPCQLAGQAFLIVVWL